LKPLVQQQLKNIEALLDDLREALGDTNAALKKKQAAYTELTRLYWSRGSKVAALDHNAAEYEVLTRNNERLEQQRQELRARLERVLAHTKSLAKAVRT